MKSKMCLSIIIILALLGSVEVAYAQSKYDKMIAKAEGAYEIGDYGKAMKYLAKFNKKASKKLGKQNAYTPTYNLLLAKYNLASGLVVEFETNVQAAVTSSVAINKENSQKHGLLLLDIAKLYNLNGAYRTAEDYVDQAQKVLDAGSFLDQLTKAQLDVVRAQALSGKGFYNEALDLLRANEKIFSGRALRTEAYVDDKGNLKTRKLDSEEADKRYAEYANLLTLMGITFGEQGNLRSADSTFVFAATWIRKNLGESSLSYIKNQLFNADVLVENGNETLPKDLEYSRTLNSLKIKHKPSHYIGVSIYEEYLKQLLGGSSKSRYLNTKLEFEKMINSSFDKGSIYSARLKAVDFDAKKSKDRTRNLENDAVNMLSNSAGLPKNNITTVHILQFLYDLAIQEKKFPNAEGYLNEIVKIKTELYGEKAPNTHLAKIHLANFYMDYTNKLVEASAIYQDSFTGIVEKEIGAWHKDHLEILNHIATLYELTDKYKEATVALDKASDVARSKYSDTDYQYGAELTNIAKLQLKLGEYEKAEANLNKSLAILENFRKEDDKKIYLINAIDAQAVLFGIKGMFDEAEDALDRSSRMIARSNVDLGIDELSTAQELASLFIQLGRYSTTEKLLNKLVTEYERLYGSNSLRLIDPLVNKGQLTLAKGDYTDAEKIAQRVNGIALTVYGEKSTKTAPSQKLLSSIYYTIGDYDKALDNIQKALASQEKQFGRSHIETAKSISQLALIKFYKGDDPKLVEKLMLEARDIMGDRLGKDNPQYAEILKNVAVLYISEKRYDIAFSSLTQAENIWRTKTGSKNNINAASIYSLTGDVYYQLKNYDKAEDFYDKSKDIYERSFNRSHPEYVKVLSKLAKVYYMEKDFKRAKKNIEEALANYEGFLKQFFPALSEREKAQYWNTIKPDFEFYNTLAFSKLDDFKDLSGKVYNYQLLTKALLLSSSIKMKERILNSTDENLKATYANWVDKKEVLTKALSMSTQQLADNEIDPAALGTEVENLEKELSEKSELFGQGFENKKITYENVQKALGKTDVAMEMVRYRYFDHVFTDSIIYVALYLRNDNSRPKAVQLPKGQQMETRYFKYYRNCITGRIKDQFSYSVFWEPIESQIGQYSTLFLSPDGVYNQLNLEAIPTPDGKYVIDNSNIVIVSNTKDLYLRKIKSKQVSSNTATMFGNPTFYLTASTGNVPSLPGTEKEVEELQTLLNKNGWKTTEYTEKSASEERVKEVDSPKIFHIATHGFYTPSEEEQAVEIGETEAEKNENPLLKTGLLLKGAGDLLGKTKYNYNIESGILTAYEAMSLNLDNTDLVVLSACETGLGEISNGEGVYGLQRAFLVAGAKTLIMSMFKVDDLATQKLILSFYKKWLTTGNLRPSFLEAKKELRIEYPDPIYWGAFMMIGLD